MARVIENPKDLILSTANTLVRETGLNGLNIRKVASACGIAPGTIYNYFPSKGALLIAMMEAFWREVFNHLTEEFNQTDSLATSVKSLKNDLDQNFERFRMDWLSQIGAIAREEQISCQAQEQGAGILMDTLIKLVNQHNASLPPKYQTSSGRVKIAKFLHYTLMGTLQRQIDPDYFEDIIDQLFAQS